MKALGRHTLIEYFDCNVETLKNQDRIREILLNAVCLSNATIVMDTFHSFSPYGVSGVVVIAESHVTIHTWPEHSYAAVDVFTCGETVKAEVIESEIKTGLGSKEFTSQTLERGPARSRRRATQKQFGASASFS